MKRPPITPGHWDMHTDIRTGPGPEYNPWYDQWILDSDTRKLMAIMEVPRLATTKAHTLEVLREHRECMEEVGANAVAIAALPQLLEALEAIVKADEDATKQLKELYGIQPSEGALHLQSMARAALIAAGYTED